MREIRYRAKRKDTGEWIKSSTLARFDDDSGSFYFMPRSQSKCWASADDNGNITDMDCTFFHVDPDTVGQFIGAQDAYGEDIFEDDIVRHNDKLYVIRYLPPLCQVHRQKQQLPARRVLIQELHHCWQHPRQP